MPASVSLPECMRSTVEGYDWILRPDGESGGKSVPPRGTWQANVVLEMRCGQSDGRHQCRDGTSAMAYRLCSGAGGSSFRVLLGQGIFVDNGRHRYDRVARSRIQRFAMPPSRVLTKTSCLLSGENAV